MYISPFVAGIVVGCLVETVALVVVALYVGGKK